MADSDPEHELAAAERYLDAASAVLGMEVAAEDRALVAENLRVLASMAALVLEEPLADNLEPAAVFRA